MNQNQKEIKVVLLGDSGVGKSSILMRFCSNEFQEGREPTLGAAFMSKVIQVQGQYFKFQIWDTAGQEKYKSLTPLYYRDAQVALIVYDISNKDTFEVLKNWVEELKTHGPKKIMNVLVGNKQDLIDKEQVSYDEAKRYAYQLGAVLKLTSCKDNTGIKELFQQIGEAILDQEQQAQLNQPSGMTESKKDAQTSQLKSSKQQSNKDKKNGCC